MAAITAVIGLVDRHVPVLSLGVLYLFAVLPVAVLWGRTLAIAVSVASMVAFNFYFLPPTHTLTLQDSRNWFALGVFIVTSVVVSELAARSRRRATESALLAEIAGSLLERGDVSAQLERIGAEVAVALQAEHATIELGPAPDGYPLLAGGRRVGTIRLVNPRPGGAAARKRLLPALASLLGVAIDRQRLAREALEAETLRRSDTVKTAVLRAVSHDLRSPLMAILTSASALARSDLELDQDDRRELVATILGEADRLERVIGNLLDLSRLEAGAAQPQPEVWPVDELLAQAIGQLGESGSRIAVELPEEPLAVRGRRPADRAGAREPVRERAQILARAGARPRAASGDDEPRCSCASSTTGPGWRSADRERIFEPFQRGCRRSATAPALGSRSPAGFAEANGGRVWAESRAGPGRDFRARATLRPGELRERTAHPGRRRRAADPARAADEPARRGLRGRDRRDCRDGARGRGDAAAGGGDPRPRPPGRHRHRRRARAAHLELGAGDRPLRGRRRAREGGGTGRRRRRLRHEAGRDRRAARPAARGAAAGDALRASRCSTVGDARGRPREARAARSTASRST